MEGMISKELVELQKYALVESDSKLTAEKWAKELVIRLLEITHGQWLYRNVMVHDRSSGDLVTRRKEEIRKELEEQLALGGEDLEEDDMFLLEIKLKLTYKVTHYINLYIVADIPFVFLIRNAEQPPER